MSVVDENASSEIETGYIELGKILKAKREDHGITQQEIADILKMGRPNYANIEAGRQRIALHLAIPLARFFKIDLNALFSKGLRSRIEWEAPTSQPYETQRP